MAAPYPRRGPMQGQARAVNRGAKGMAQGRFAGLARVERTERSSALTPKTWLFEGVVEDIVPVETDYPYFVWDDTKTC